ncbi:MAG TPA: Ig-like domain-containing protein [Bacteroidales bacterium]|nr:Ig-like domain-containing protein [Bacteroidales bacterium]
MRISGYSIICILVLSIIIGGCAKLGSIQGGAKDTTPPKVVGSKPDNEATNFNDKKVEITFDEFIKFKDKDKAFVTSPPFKKKPEVILKYKSVVVNFNEDLLPDRTYTLNFGNSITDNNEGNPIRDFEFVFSTGSHIDSLSFEGKVLSAFDHKPDKEGLFVMLYDLLGDSVPMKNLPAYTTKTNEKGFFRINHIKADTFRLVAIKDANSNFMYEPGEQVAFSDSFLILNNAYYHKPDTAAARDTATTDSAYYSRFKPQVTLYSFVNENKKQYLTSKDRKQANLLTFNFNVPLDTFKILLEDHPDASPWFLKEVSANRDSFNLWITDTALLKKDTLRTVLVYPVPDSLNVLYAKYDTLSMVYKAPRETRRSKAAKEENTFTISTNAKEGFDLNNDITAETSLPIGSIDESKIHFTYTEDSIYKDVKYRLKRDSVHFRRFTMDFDPVANAQYSLVFDSLAIQSIYGNLNDSTGIVFKTQRDDYYGAIKATFSNVIGKVIVQVLDEKETLVKSYVINEDRLLTIDFLAPGNYFLKVIHDTNGSGKWDPGDLIQKIQPEKVEYYKDKITVRSNWDVEVNWELEK